MSLSLASPTMPAQEDGFEDNENAGRNYCVVHTDKTFYVSGEVIWFKAYLPPTLEYRRSLVRVDLIDRNQKVLHTQYVRVNRQNNISGYYLIPYDFRPGIYGLTITAFEEDGNLPHTLAYHPIAIYNDLHPFDTTAVDSKELISFEAANININQNARLEVFIDRSVYRPRQKIQLTLKLTDQMGKPLQGNLSVSVADDDLVNNHTDNLSNISKGPVVEEVFLVDNEIAVRGVVRKVTDGSLYETDYLGALLREEGLLRIFESYDNGKFELDLAYFEGSRQMQLVGYFEDDLRITLERTMHKPENIEKPDLIYTKGILRYMEISRKRKKINQLFDQLAFRNLPYPPVPKNRLVPDRSLDLSLYESFASMEEFFRQVVTPLKIKKDKDGGYEIRMVNPDNKPFYPGVPKFMIDGYFIENPLVAVNMEMKSLSRIDLFYFSGNSRRQFDQFGNNGVVAIYTRDGNILNNGREPSNIFEIHGGMPPADFPEVSNLTSDSRQTTPIFRPVVYWNPSLNTTEKGEVKISFFHTDDKGKFRIEVLGDCGNGEMVIGTIKYQVQ